MIIKQHLDKHIEFLGVLTAEEMKKELLNANVFLSSSSNENSSNAIGEAQLLGVPCLASYVGGTPSMIPNHMCGEMYNFHDIPAMAYKICSMFDTTNTYDNTQMKKNASKRHDKEIVKETVLGIYTQLIKTCE